MNLGQAFNRVRLGQQYPENTFFSRPHVIWHRVGIPDTTTGSPGKLNFFNANKSSRVTNLTTAGRMPTNNMFSLEKVAFFIEQGYDIADNAEADHTVGAEDWTAPSVITVQNAIRLLYTHGVVRMGVGNRIAIDDVYGLHNFPWGSEPRVTAAAVENTNTTVAAAIMQVAVGTGSSQDGYWFDNPVPIYPDRPIELSVDYSGLNIDTQADLVIRAGLFGRLVSVTNL